MVTVRQIFANKAHSWNFHHRPSFPDGFAISVRRFQFQVEKCRKRGAELEWLVIATLLVSGLHRGREGGGFCMNERRNSHSPFCVLIPLDDNATNTINTRLVPDVILREYGHDWSGGFRARLHCGIEVQLQRYWRAQLAFPWLPPNSH